MNHPYANVAVPRVPDRRTADVLVVDDQAIMRNLLRVGLSLHGFNVWLAASGVEALDLYREHSEGVAAALMDVHMPGMNGPQTLAALRKLNPKIRCCFMTGNPDPYTEKELEQLSGTTVLAKPFVLAAVAQVLRPLVDSTRSLIED
jgi:CheY-like chemotaxis protein